MAQHSSRWLNRGAMAPLFANASFVRPDPGAPSTRCASLRVVLAPLPFYGPQDTMHVPLRWARAALCLFGIAPRLSPLRREQPGC